MRRSSVRVRLLAYKNLGNISLSRFFCMHLAERFGYGTAGVGSSPTTSFIRKPPKMSVLGDFFIYRRFSVPKKSAWLLHHADFSHIYGKLFCTLNELSITLVCGILCLCEQLLCTLREGTGQAAVTSLVHDEVLIRSSRCL